MKTRSSGILTRMLVRSSAVATLVAALAVASTAVAAPKPAARMPASAPTKNVKKEAAPAVPAPAKSPDGKASKIVCDTPVHDFGTSWMGPDLKHTFVIHNKGDAPLEISRVRPSCGCTKAGPHPKILQPGERGGFPFLIKSTKLRGRYEKSITISTNDPDNPQYKLKLQGYCKRYVDVVPSNATFGKVFGDEPQERILKITNNTDDPIEISVEPKKDGQFTFEIIEKTPGKEYELLVRMEPPFALGQSRNYTTIRTSNDKQKEIKVAATAHVPPRLDIQPNPIRINERKAEDRGYKRTIRFTNYGKNPVKILEAVVGDTKITTEVTERTSGKAYTIALQIPPGYKTPATGTMLTLKTDDAKQPTIEIPIQSSARARKTPSTRSRPADALVGKAAPSFSLTTTAGKELSNLTMKDTVTVLDFFAVNCGFCKKQIPRLEKIRQDYEKKGVRFVAVSQTMRKKFSDEDVKAKINDLGFKGELAIDSGNTVGPLFKATGFPTMIVVGKDGKVGAVNIGNVGDLESRMKTQLDALLAGKPVPAMARSASKKPSRTDKPRKRPAEQMVGKPTPSFSLTTTAGKPLSNATCKDKVTVLDFFAVNCGYCKKQIPRLETVRQKYEAKGVRFVTVSQTMRKKFTDDEIKAKIDGLGFKGELAIDSGNTVGPLFKATSFPTMVILDKKGNIGAVNIGNVGDLESRMAKQLDALLAGKPVPTIAAAAKPSKPAKASLLGKPAPKFSLKTTAGKDLSNASTKDKVTVLDFFAVNCGYCKKQIPRLETIRAEYEKKGVRFVAVSQTMRKKFSDEDIKAKIDGLGFKGELAIDSGNTVGPLFNATGFPTMIVLDKKGNIGAINVGNIGDLETRLKGQLDAMLAGKPVPAKFASSPKKKSRERPATKLVGKPAPKFADFQTLDGKTVSYDGFAKQKATVFNFVAPNCGFCKRALPNVEKVRQAYESKGVRFINVAQTMRKKYPVEEVKKIIDGTGSKLELAYDGDNIVGKLYKAVSFPTMIVVDSKGKVAYVNIGAKKDLEQLLSGQLDTLIKAAQ